jgi:hypothetical protein
MSESVLPRCWREAARRHFKDAEYLLDAQPARLANADHHYGIAAECVVKAFLAAGHHRQGNRWQAPERVHINDPALWSELKSIAGPDRKLVPYIQMLSEKPFTNWRVTQRYHCDESQCFKPQAVHGHREAARKFLQTLEQAIQNSVLP